MDEDYRIEGRNHVRKAHGLESSRISKEIIASEYMRGIHCYEQISDKKKDDYRALAYGCSYVAVIHFNRAHYDKAAEFYKIAINYLLKIEDKDRKIKLEDKDYRQLIELYIDLSDTYLHQFRLDDAHNVISLAKEQFNLIVNKFPEELLIGDPNDNYKQFRAYFEKKSSTESYLNSVAYRNHEHILYEKHEESNLLDMLSKLSLPEKESYTESIEKMLNGLSLSNGINKSYCSPITLNEFQDDARYRDMAIEFLRLTQTHVQNGGISDTFHTYKQALSALNAIKQKSQFDYQSIQLIQDQISYLASKLSKNNSSIRPEIQPIIEQNHQTYSTLISRIGMFEHSIPQESMAHIEEESSRMELD